MEIEKLTWSNDIAATLLTIIKKIELINKKKFTAAALSKKAETFVVHLAPLEARSIYPYRKA